MPPRQPSCPPLRKKQKQEPSRFVPCPVCHRSFPSYFIHDHVNLCLDSPATGHTQSPSTTFPSASRNVNSKDDEQLGLSAVGVEEDANSEDRLKSSSPEQGCTNPLLAFSSEVHVGNSSAYGSVDDRDGGATMPEENCACGSIECPRATEAQDAMALPEEDVSGKPGHGLQIFQVQRQSQAKLSMLCKFPMSAAFERKPTATVLQPGMVLLRSWLSLDIQQRLVNESQSAARLFKRPTTAGGGKYHLWQMAFGCQWDSKTRRYAAQNRGQRFPAWMYDLGKELASDAHGQG